ENAPAVGQPRDAQVITESGRQSRVAPHGRVSIDRFSACLPTTANRARGRLSGGLFVLLAGDLEQQLALSLNPPLSLFRFRPGFHWPVSLPPPPPSAPVLQSVCPLCSA